MRKPHRVCDAAIKRKNTTEGKLRREIKLNAYLVRVSEQLNSTGDAIAFDYSMTTEIKMLSGSGILTGHVL